jgi:hypothetical protein
MKTVTDIIEEKPITQPKESTSVPNKIISNLKKLHAFPENIIKVDAIKLYLNRWRVNVWVHSDNNAKVEASWFVIAEPDGTIIEAR